MTNTFTEGGKKIRIRSLFLFLHRWAGLLMAAFLIVEGLTGTLLAFRSSLERLITPQLFIDGRPGQQPLDLATLTERAEAIVEPRARTAFLEIDSGRVLVACAPRNNPATGKPYELGFSLFLNPYTGQELGRRHDGDLRQGRINLLPFIFDLHASLALGATGRWILGIIALCWTLDSFVGLYLTLPQGAGGFWRRWKVSWAVKWKASSFRINFDLHRAGGLWLWLLLIVFGWSSVMLALPQIYEPVMNTVFDFRSNDDYVRQLKPHRVEHPKLDWHAGLAAAQRLMDQQAALHHFTVIRPYGLEYVRAYGYYYYSVRTSADIQSGGWDTSLSMDGDTGELLDFTMPSGQHLGNTLSTWMLGIHFADLRGSLPFRIFISVFGLIVAMLAATGVYIWWKKRRLRQSASAGRVRVSAQVARK